MLSHDFADIMIFRFRFRSRAFTNRMPTVCLTRWKQRTNTSWWRNDGASKENLYFDDQKKEVDSPSFFAVFSKRNKNKFSVFLRNRFQVAVRHRWRKMSKKRKSEAIAECVTDVLSTFAIDVFCDLLLNRRIACNMESICCYNMESNYYRKSFFLFRNFST